MQLSALTRASLNSLKCDLVTATSEVFHVQDSKLNESFARGFGVNTHAALIAALDGILPRKQMAASGSESFDNAAFTARMSELADDRTAESVSAILDGARVSVTLTKRPPARQNPVRFLDIAYDVLVKISGVSPEVLESSPEFLIPEFFKPDGTELYRLDCDWSLRVASDYAVGRKDPGQGLLNTKVVDGRWSGGLYVYSLEHQQDDSRCLRSVKGALARAILPALTPRVRCSIFRPSRYQYGAWRVNISLGPVVRKFLGNSPLVFTLPTLLKRNVVMEPGFMRDLHIAAFQNGEWAADVYSNGIDEDDNPTTIARVKAQLLSSVNKTLKDAGFTG
jgi:hypothetical protein